MPKDIKIQYLYIDLNDGTLTVFQNAIIMMSVIKPYDLNCNNTLSWLEVNFLRFHSLL